MNFSQKSLRAAWILGLALAGLPLTQGFAQDRARSRLSVEPFAEDAAPSAFAAQGQLLDYRSESITPEWQQHPRAQQPQRQAQHRNRINVRQASYAEPADGEMIVEEGETIHTPNGGRSMRRGAPVQHGDYGNFDNYDDFGMHSDGCGCDSCSGAGCSTGCCGDSCCGSGDCWMPWHDWGGCICIKPFFDEFSVFAGPHGFKNPVDGGLNGNFGFHEGAQIGGPLFPCLGVGYQFGAQATQSDLSGSLVGVPDDGTREQVFVTGGIFHRAWCGYGFQWGVVADYLSDNFYAEFELTQVRGEFSFIGRCGNEVGFWAAGGGDDDFAVMGTANRIAFEPTDMYAIFYRRNICGGGEGRVWLGGTEGEDGIFGADFRVPVTNRWDLTGGFNYKIPQEDDINGAAEESFAIGMNLVWYPGRCRTGKHNGPWRPLLNVADNGTFMVEMADAAN